MPHCWQTQKFDLHARALFPEPLSQVVQSVHHVHHPDQLLLHGHVRPGALDQVPGVSTHSFQQVPTLQLSVLMRDSAWACCFISGVWGISGPVSI